MKNKNYLIFSLVFFILFLALLILVSLNITQGFDNSFNSFFSGIRNTSLTSIMLFFTWIMDEKVVFILSLFLMLFLISLKKKKEFLFVISVFVFGYLIKEFFKILIHRARPLDFLFKETGFSFPSGHATFAVLFFLTLIYLFKDNLKNYLSKILLVSLSILIILFVGLSRIYLGVHFLTDVLGGFFLGISLFYLFLYFFRIKQ